MSMYAAGPAMQATEKTNAAALARALRMVGLVLGHGVQHLRENQALKRQIGRVNDGEARERLTVLQTLLDDF